MQAIQHLSEIYKTFNVLFAISIKPEFLLIETLETRLSLDWMHILTKDAHEKFSRQPI